MRQDRRERGKKVKVEGKIILVFILLEPINSCGVELESPFLPSYYCQHAASFLFYTSARRRDGNKFHFITSQPSLCLSKKMSRVFFFFSSAAFISHRRKEIRLPFFLLALFSPPSRNIFSLHNSWQYSAASKAFRNSKRRNANHSDDKLQA